MNPLLLTDSYKISHWKQYPPKTEKVMSFFEAREGSLYPETLFFGLQYILKKYLVGPVVSRFQINKAEVFCQQHFGRKDLFNLKGWERILSVHNGHLPVRIKAVPEGTRVPVGNVLMTVENTDPELPWLTNYLETLLVQVWYPTTVATQSYMMKQDLLRALEKSGDPSLIDFKLHDFGFRGSTSVESSGIGGCAHLVNFKGTDTMSALEAAAEYYDEDMAGFSIPAAEHSTVTSWGREHEVDAFANMLHRYGSGLVAVVSDSYDIFHACEHLWGTDLKDRVLERDGVLVVRPDSGNPISPMLVRVLNILGDKFGWTENSKGYRLLNPKVRVIQGDGINANSLKGILHDLLAERWSIDNVAFGSGGGLLQQVNRDTCRFAFKCCAIKVDGQWREVRKAPITDLTKASKGGRLSLFRYNDEFITMDMEKMKSDVWRTVSVGEDPVEVLQTVFENGKLIQNTTLEKVRLRV